MGFPGSKTKTKPVMHIDLTSRLANQLWTPCEGFPLRFREPNLAESYLKRALEKKELVNVGVAGDEVCGIAFWDADNGWEVYSTESLCVPELVKDRSCLADDQKSTFWRDGYLVFPGLLAAEAGVKTGDVDFQVQDDSIDMISQVLE